VCARAWLHDFGPHAAPAQRGHGPGIPMRVGLHGSMEAGHSGLCEQAAWDSARWPLIFFLFFWIVQTGAKFKILYKFDLKLDKYEINFLG
jgi:hypothetical protein